MVLSRPIELGEIVVMLLPHKIGRLLFQVMDDIGNTLAWLDAYKQVYMVLVYLVNLDAEIAVPFLCIPHCSKQVIPYRIEAFPTVLRGKYKMISKECLGVVEAFIFAHVLNIVKFLIKSIAFPRKINYNHYKLDSI